FSRNFNIEESVKKFPSVKFIFLLEEATEGDMINIGIGESSSSYVFVLRDTLNITSNFFPSYVADKIIHSDDFCIVPRLLNKNGESIPINFFPTQEKGHFRVRFSNHLGDGTKTLYPFDFIGLYNRKKFIQLGGFDYTILSPYYQNLDLSIRSYLWGEKIKTTTTFMISYQDEVPIEDITLDLSYLHFYLKNMMPHYKVDEGCYVPRFAFLSFLKKSPCGIFESQKIFSDGKRWIEKNRLRFQTDLYNLIEMWE
ncbi:MAG: hypothetical protein IKI31_01890, partial [Treponema sp.]|nr:hypothetical protein [Treponema sp.]